MALVCNATQKQITCRMGFAGYIFPTNLANVNISSHVHGCFNTIFYFFLINYYSFFGHFFHATLHQISSRCQDSLTTKVQMLYFLTKIGGRAQAPLPHYISPPTVGSHLKCLHLIIINPSNELKTRLLFTDSFNWSSEYLLNPSSYN